MYSIPLSYSGAPAMDELMILLFIFGVFGVVIGGWIYRDARSRGSTWAWQWAVGVFFLFLTGFVPGLVGLAIYFDRRKEQVQEIPV
ncbi:hypothetical protein ACFQMM_11595 [Saliphagus sp. GCM10025308]